MRIWVDLTNTAHVLVLRPLVDLLEERGHEVQLTVRPLSHTVELLDDWGHPYTVVGRYGGATRVGKARAAASRVPRLLTFGRGRRFDWALAHGSTDLPPACRLLRIPNTTMFDYEWASLQHGVNCRLADRVLVPDVIPPARLERYGARPPKLVRYPGLKEEYYLADFEQRRAVAALGLDRVTVPARAVDGRSLVALADVLVSAGGTMNREAAVLGTPVWSVFEGRPGAVDEQLVREGRLRLLRDPDDVVIAKKPADSWQGRARRDPEDLLALATPPGLS
jgi:predicted glycosyltransferase